MKKKVHGKQWVKNRWNVRMTLLFKAGMEIKQNDTVPGKTYDVRELLAYLH